MINNPTPYTIEKQGERLTVLKDGKIEAYGFINMNDALEGVYCLEGKNPNHFYVQHKGVVSRTNRDEL